MSEVQTSKGRGLIPAQKPDSSLTDGAGGKKREVALPRSRPVKMASPYERDKPRTPMSGIPAIKYSLRLYSNGNVKVERNGIEVDCPLDKLDKFLHEIFTNGQ